MRAAIIALLILSILCSASYAKEARKLPIISCETYSLRDYFGSGRVDYLTAPSWIKSIAAVPPPILGICYNSIWMKSYDTAYLDSIKKAVKDAGMTITGFIIEGNIATLDDAARNRQIAEDIKELRAAAYLGAPVVRINLGGTDDDARDDTVGVQRCIDAFKEMLPTAKYLKVKMTIENHGGVSLNADRIIRIIKGTDPKWVGSCLDFGNFGNDVRNTECAKLAPYAYHVHAKCRNFLDNGEEKDMDYKYLIGLLQKAKYTGAISIEFEGGGEQIQGVRKTLTLIRRYWPELAK